MYFVGIDVGSVAAKAVVIDGDSNLIAFETQPTGWSPKTAGRTVFEAALSKGDASLEDVKKVVGTGYGRVSLDFIDKAVTEITCHALGANYYFPDNALVIDIGGQDSKAIQISKDGRVVNFVMNDKCAAGTGRFLQVMAMTMGLELGQLEGLTLEEPITINSMCTVFAESEVVSLIAAGVKKEKVIAGLYQSIAKRTAAMTGSFDLSGRAIFTGGVAKNQGMQKALSKVLGLPVVVPEEPQIIGALGAALLAKKLT